MPAPEKGELNTYLDSSGSSNTSPLHSSFRRFTRYELRIHLFGHILISSWDRSMRFFEKHKKGQDKTIYGRTQHMFSTTHTRSLLFFNFSSPSLRVPLLSRSGCLKHIRKQSANSLDTIPKTHTQKRQTLQHGEDAQKEWMNTWKIQAPGQPASQQWWRRN